MTSAVTIRDIRPEEYEQFGRMMVEVYSRLESFPSPDEQPEYYRNLSNVRKFTGTGQTRVLVAVTPEEELAGGVVYFGDMAEYGSGGKAPQERNASGIRLLGVAPKFQGAGVGRALTSACIELAMQKKHANVVLHTTMAMKLAWDMYERIGFVRAEDLDFLQEGLPVYGFRLKLRY